MKNCKWDTRGHIVSYENDHGDTITDYKQLSKSMGLDDGIEHSSHSSYSGGGSSVSGGTPGIRTFLTSGVLLISVIAIIIAWIVAAKSENNLYFIAFIITIALVIWDGFLIYISLDDFSLTIGKKSPRSIKKKKIKESRRNF